MIAAMSFASARMIRFAGRLPLVGSTLRWWASRYPEGSVVVIRSGRASGYQWQRSHRYPNGFWLGQFELPVQDALTRELRPGDTFYDVGANAGFFTLVAARAVGPTGRTVSFDPDPVNIANIEAQLKLNELASSRAIREAVSGAEGEATFSFDTPGSPMGHLGPTRAGETQITVPVTTIDAAIAKYGTPSLLKIDVEGMEAEVLKGADRVLSEVKPSLIIELHSPQCKADCSRILRAHGYEFFALDGSPVRDAALLPTHVLVRHPARARVTT